MNPGDIKNLSKSVTDNEIEVILQSIHTNKSPKGQMGSFISLKKKCRGKSNTGNSEIVSQKKKVKSITKLIL